MQDHDGAIRPRRSALYVPAANARAIDKARTLACDMVILDLEDSVAPEAKAAAREQAVRAIGGGGFGDKEVIVRINGEGAAWAEDDLAAVLASGADGMLAPKVGHPSTIGRYGARIAAAGSHVSLWAMIETCGGVLDARAIASAGAPLAGLVVGTNDLATEMRCRPTPDRAPLQSFLALIVAAAHESGLVALDGVYGELDDLAGFEGECRQGADFGFDGKTLIHPSQIEPCNRLYAPSAEDVAWAEAVVAAFAGPDANGKGAIRLQGRMVERLHLRDAERLLQRAR